MDHPIVHEVRNAAETLPGVEICDLHVWRVGRRKYACIVSVVVDDPRDSQEFRRILSTHDELPHITVEVFLRPSATAAQAIADVPADR
jgi:Co/Zn/Cd efflux system component